jgi:hypothetical protein
MARPVGRFCPPYERQGAPEKSEGTEAFRFFTPPEAAVIVALVDTLIPKDEVGPGGVEVGVPIFIDRELDGAYGRGARMYLNGPFAEGTPQQGYQLPLPPAELYRLRGHGSPAASLCPPYAPFAARLTPGGGFMSSGTNRSGASGWLGSTR